MFPIFMFIVGAVLGFAVGFFVFRNNKEISESIAQKIVGLIKNIGK